VIVGDPIARARAEVEFANGLELGGGPMVEYARRHRVLAGDVLELCEQLESARSLVAAQDDRIARLEALLMRRGDGVSVGVGL
jgi:hypothetical protein